MTSHRPSLQTRLLFTLVGLVSAAWLVTGLLTWIDVRHELEELLDAHLAQAAALLVVEQSKELDEDERRVDAPILHRYAPKVAFQVYHDGQLVLRSANATERSMSVFREGASDGFRTVSVDGTIWRVFATRGADLDVQVFVGEQAASRDAILWAVLRSALVPMLLALPLIAVAAWWGVHAGLQPLRALGKSLGVRSPDALHPLALAGAPSEMTPMLTALNGLFERISGLMRSERRFTADAAHELRTPIAAIRAQTQVAIGTDNDAERSQAEQAALRGCDQASRLVDQLLTLSRLDAGSVPMFHAVDLVPIVRETVAELAPWSIDKRQGIALEGPDRCMVRGDATLLRVLVRNLVDNAIRYTPCGGAVQVAVLQRSGRVTLTVDDSGPGIAPQQRARLGERFFRVLGTGQSGSGLGWSIVSRIAETHGAQLRVDRSVRLGGLGAAVEFPGEAPTGDGTAGVPEPGRLQRAGVPSSG